MFTKTMIDGRTTIADNLQAAGRVSCHFEYGWGHIDRHKCYRSGIVSGAVVCKNSAISFNISAIE